MNDEGGRGNETGQGKTIGNLLDHGTGRTKSGGSNIRAAVDINNTADDNVGDGHAGLADNERSSVVLGVAHLSSDGKVSGSASIGKDERRDSRDGLGEGSSLVDDLVVRLPGALLGGIRGTVLNTDGDGNSKDGSEKADQSNPGKPADAAQSLDASKTKADDGGDGDENGSACAVRGDGVEGDRDTEHTRASDKDPDYTS